VWVTVEEDRITGLEEKSERPRSNLINAGAYIFDPDIFDLLAGVTLSGRGEYELTDALASYIARGSLVAYALSYWLDVGQPWDLLDANEALLSSQAHEQHGTIEDGCTIPDTVSIGRGTVIRTGDLHRRGACSIGEDCVIGPHAYIRGSTAIGDGCHIGHATEIKKLYRHALHEHPPLQLRRRQYHRERMQLPGRGPKLQTSGMTTRR